MTEEERRQLREVYDFIQALKSSTSIPFEVGEAFRERLKPEAKVSTKTVASETQEVNEGGSAPAYNVPKLHDGYKEEVFGGQVIYLPYYT